MCDKTKIPSAKKKYLTDTRHVCNTTQWGKCCTAFKLAAVVVD